jgi:uncharacterized protein YceK
MRKLVPLILIAAVVALSGCGVSVSKTSESTAKDAVEKMTFARNTATGQCFGVVSSSKAMTANDNSMTITWVPCDPKVLAEIAK